MNKIRRVSLFFVIVFQVIFVGWPISIAMAWANAPKQLTLLNGFLQFNAIPEQYRDKILHTLIVPEKILGFAIDLLPTTVGLFVLYCLIRLFSLYTRGQIFSIQNVNYIRKIGYALLVWQLIINPIYQFLMGVALTLNNPPGHRMAILSLNQTNIALLLTAGLIILISWIMAEGYQLREEQQLTI